MFISDEAVQEFKELYKQEYGIELDEKETRRKAIKVLNVMKIVYGPLKIPINQKGVILNAKT